MNTKLELSEAIRYMKKDRKFFLEREVDKEQV